MIAAPPIVIDTATLADLDDLLRIEQQSWPDPWEPMHFAHAMQHRNNVAKLAYCQLTCEAIGFALYDVMQDQVWLVNLSVAADIRRAGVGRELLQHVERDAQRLKRYRVFVSVDERNIEAQLFLRSCGYRCFGIRHNEYGEDCDGYTLGRRLDA